MSATTVDDPHGTASVSAERMLTNAALWGDLPAELVDAIVLDHLEDEWCRVTIAAVIVLRDDGQDVTLSTVHRVLLDAGIHHDIGDVWQLAMADVTAADGRLDEDAATIYLERIRAAHLRRVGRQALLRAAHRLETSTDPGQVLAELAHEVVNA